MLTTVTERRTWAIILIINNEIVGSSDIQHFKFVVYKSYK